MQKENPIQILSLSNRLLAFIFITLGFNGTIIGQGKIHPINELHFQQYSINQGLSHSSVNSIIQDQYGFLWIGTFDGLNRFDGMNFSVFKKDPGDTSTLINDRILTLYEDNGEFLWIGTEEGISILDLKTLHFNTFSLPSQLQSSKLEVRKIVNIHNNEIWILTGNTGLIRASVKGNLLEGMDLFVSLLPGSPSLNDVLRLSGDLLIFSTSSGIFSYQPEENKFEQLLPDLITNARTIIEAEGSYFLGTNYGLFELKYDRNGFQLERVLFNNAIITSIEIDKNGNLWVATNGSGLIFGEKKQDTFNFTNYKHDPYRDNSISADRLTCIYEDHFGNIWSGTMEQGFDRIDYKTNNFISIRNEFNPLVKTSSSYVTCLGEVDDDNIFVGYRNGGINLFNISTHNFLPLRFNDNLISGITISGCFKDSKKNLWFLSWDGLYRVRDGMDFPEIVSLTPGNESPACCYCIEEDDNGRIWVGTREGLYCMKQEKNGIIKSIITIEGNDNSLKGESILSLKYLDEKKEMLVGTQHAGLFVIKTNETDLSNDMFRATNYSYGNKSVNGLWSNYISCIYKTKEGKIYLGTEGGGLTLLKESAEGFSFESYNKDHGLTNNVIKSIREDNKGHLWISTNNGLFQFDPIKIIFTAYTYRDGLQSNAFNYPSLRNTEGLLFFGGIDGFTYFQPESIKKDTIPPSIVLNDFYLFYKKLKPGSKMAGHAELPAVLSSLDTIVLRHNENTFSIEIVPIHYRDPLSNKIKYRLENYDNTWIQASAYSNIASYSKLKPGQYTLNVHAGNSNDAWTKSPKTLHIIIKPPVWQTKGAFVIYAIVFILTIYFTYSVIARISRLRNDLKIEQIAKEKENQLNEAKLQFFTNISHEFKTPVSLIMGPVYWLSERLNNNPEYAKKLGLIHRQASYLSKLIDQLLEFRRIEKDTLKLRCTYTDIIGFASNIKESFESYAQQKNITFELESNHASVYVWFDEDKLEKVINNVLSNAFKYTPPKGIINMRIKLVEKAGKDESVLIQISDTGKGISKEALPHIFTRFYQETEAMGGYGIGLALTRSLIELHKGKIWAESDPGKGSTFFIELLLGDAHIEEKEKFHPTVSNNIALDEIIKSYGSTSELESEVKNIFVQNNNDAKKTLMIVEDHYELRCFLRDIFQNGFRVVLAENGVEALELIEKENPAGIISDIMMPQMDGIELCKKIKTDINTSHIPVILLTSRESIQNRIEGLETGADSYITKPFQVNHLFAQLNNLLKNRELLYEKFKSGIPLDLNSIPVNSMDTKFIRQVMEIMNSHLEDSDFDTDQFAGEMYMNRTDFYRKMKAITNFTPGEFLRNFRLSKAAEFISREKLNVSEVIYRTGFKSRSHFTRCFKEKYGTNPTDFKTGSAFSNRNGEGTKINIAD